MELKHGLMHDRKCTLRSEPSGDSGRGHVNESVTKAMRRKEEYGHVPREALPNPLRICSSVRMSYRRKGLCTNNRFRGRLVHG